MIKFIKKYFKTFLSSLKFDNKVKNIMFTGFKISFVLTLFSILILSIYTTSNPNYLLFDLGISLFKSSSIFFVMFFISGIAFNKIYNSKNIK